MRSSYFITCILVLTLAACQKNENLFTLKGNISHLENDTLLLYNEYSPNGEIDTIIASNGKFTFQTILDTITAYKILINGQTAYPIYADKGMHVEIAGNALETQSLAAKGGTDNDLLNLFKEKLQPGLSDNEQRAMADSFIRNNPSTFCNLYLLEHYFLRNSSVPYKQLRELITCMDGKVQDAFYTRRINEDIKQKAETDLTNAPSFNLREGKKIISSSSYYNKVYIVFIWASWNNLSRETNRMLNHIYKKYKKEKAFDMLSVSFDPDKNEWQKAIKEDSVEWKQLHEPEGFNSRIAKKFAIEKIPGLYVINSKRKIIAINPTETELIKKLDEAIKEHKEQNKKRK